MTVFHSKDKTATYIIFVSLCANNSEEIRQVIRLFTLMRQCRRMNTQLCFPLFFFKERFLFMLLPVCFPWQRGRGCGRVVRWCWVNFQCRGVLLSWIIVGQGAYCTCSRCVWGCLDIFSLSIISFSHSLSLGDGPI